MRANENCWHNEPSTEAERRLLLPFTVEALTQLFW